MRDRALEHLDHVIRQSPVALWAFDCDGVFTLLEGKVHTFLGEGARGRIGRSVFETFADVPAVAECCQRVLAGEEFDQVVTVDGRSYETQYAPLRDESGRIIGACGLSLDVTARIGVEAALRESEDKFKRIFESSLDAVTINDVSDGKYLEVNDEFTSLTGFAREEVVGRTPAELGIWSSPADFSGIRRQLRDHGLVRNVEILFRMKDGTMRWALFSAVLLSIGGQTRLLSFVRDITDRRRTEAEVRELSGRLLQLQDRERRRIALELHDSTAQTLAALAMNLALVKKSEDVLDNGAKRGLAAAIALADQCSQEIRTLSYLLHPPLLDEMGLSSALRAYTEGFAQRSGIELSCELPSEVDRLPREVETTLFRIAQEGLTNIHRHSGSRKARIRLRRDDTHAMLEIRDYGRGIPADVLQPTSELQVLGVGLPGMRARVQQLGGSFEILSGERGATIKVSLPITA
jgi:PAS domain S-box-containing protein